MEGPRNVIADTFSRLSRQDDTSALVGKKATTEDSELANYSLFDDKEIFDCLVNLPCLSSHKKRKHLKTKTLVTEYKATPDPCHKKRRRDTDQHCHHQMDHCLHNDISNQCYLNLPEDMVEDNPLDIENIKEKQDEDNELQH